MTPYEILTAAQELIRDPAKWCKRSLARNRRGYTTDPLLDDAVSFCSYGALIKISGAHGSIPNAALDVFISANGGDVDEDIAIGDLNDTHEHADIMRMFDLAREKAKAAEAA